MPSPRPLSGLLPGLGFLLLLLAACGGGGGGGGGGGSSTSPPPAPSVRTDGGVGAEEAMRIGAAPDGSFFTGGSFGGTTVFGAGEPGEVSPTASGLTDAYVARYSASMTLLWMRPIGGPGTAVTNSVAITTRGGCILVGTFRDQANFPSGQGGFTSLVASGTNDEDGFVAHYAANGDLVWVRQIQGPALQRAHAVSVAGDGSSYVTGFIDGSSTFGAGEPNETTSPTFGVADMFLARYASDGDLMWMTLAGGTLNDQGKDVHVDPLGGCVVTGSFYGQAVFGFFETNSTTLTSGGQGDMFVARYTSDGKLTWARSAGGQAGAVGLGVCILGDGSSVVTGYYGATAIFGQGEPTQTILQTTGARALFVARWDTAGGLMWVTDAVGGDAIQGFDVAQTPSGGVYVVGLVRGIGTFGAGEGTETMLATTPGAPDAFVARFGPSGELLWAVQSGGAFSDVAHGVVTLPGGALLTCGKFVANAVIGVGRPNAVTVNSQGGTDIFIARHAPNGDLD